jgi:LmbE family N-acetylglucosaminyl deacetylase
MKILFIFAHPDDEAYSAAGTIAKLSADNTVYVISLCRGDRPGNEQVMDHRQAAFTESCRLLGAASVILDNSDCQLEYAKVLKDIEGVVGQVNPDVVYTHNISDIHRDHRLVAEACMVACRPKPTSDIEEFYMCEIPASTEWAFGQIDPVFNPTTFVDITDYIELKKQVAALYSTEVYDYPDARSVESIEVTAKNRGKQIGFHYAEAFKLVFSKR